MRLLDRKNNTVPIYVKGDLLVKKRKDDYWFDHVIILGMDYSLSEYVYELFTSEGNIERRTVEWVQLNYRKEDETTKMDTEMDQKTI